MNLIIRNNHDLAAISNTVKADTHKHWMLQLFLSCEGNLNMQVKDEKIDCKCIFVDMNIRHKFNTNSTIHFRRRRLQDGEIFS